MVYEDLVELQDIAARNKKQIVRMLHLGLLNNEAWVLGYVKDYGDKLTKVDKNLPADFDKDLTDNDIYKFVSYLNGLGVISDKPSYRNVWLPSHLFSFGDELVYEYRAKTGELPCQIDVRIRCLRIELEMRMRDFGSVWRDVVSFDQIINRTPQIKFVHFASGNIKSVVESIQRFYTEIMTVFNVFENDHEVWEK